MGEVQAAQGTLPHLLTQLLGSLNAEPDYIHIRGGRNRRPVWRPPDEVIVVQGKKRDFESNKYRL